MVNGRAYDVPGTWNELSAAQLRTVVLVLHRPMPRVMARIWVVLSLLQVKRRLWLAWQLLWRVDADGRYDILLLTDWIWEDPVTLTKAVVPTLRAGGHVLGAPADGILSSLTFIEFIKLEVLYLRYRHFVYDPPKQREALNRLAGILYRPLKKGVREKYDDDHLSRYEAIATLMHPLDQLLCVLWYEGCRRAWIPRYPEVYRAGQADDREVNGTTPDQLVAESWVQSVRQLAGGALHMEQMSYVRAELALYDLNEKIAETQTKTR